MYVIRYSGARRAHLYEMTAKEFKVASADDTDDIWHERVSASVAHDIVRTDRFPHSTLLYVGTDDYGCPKIRKAR